MCVCRSVVHRCGIMFEEVWSQSGLICSCVCVAEREKKLSRPSRHALVSTSRDSGLGRLKVLDGCITSNRETRVVSIVRQKSIWITIIFSFSFIHPSDHSFSLLLNSLSQGALGRRPPESWEVDIDPDRQKERAGWVWLVGCFDCLPWTTLLVRDGFFSKTCSTSWAFSLSLINDDVEMEAASNE